MSRVTADRFASFRFHPWALVPASLFAIGAVALLCAAAFGTPRAAWIDTVTISADPADPEWIRRPIERLDFRGLRRTRPGVLRREISSEPGTLLDRDRLERDRLRLLDLGLFAEVFLDARGDSLSGDPIVVVTVRERPSLLAWPQVEWDREDGVSLGGRASHGNFRGMNERLAASLLAGGRRHASIRFSTPWTLGRRLGSGLQAYYSRSRNDSEELIDERRGLVVSVIPSRSRTVAFPIHVGVERVRVDPDPDPTRPLAEPAEPLRDDHRLVEIGAWRDTRVWRARPRDGSRMALRLVQHGGPLGGDTDMQRLHVDLLRVFPTGGNATTLTAAGRVAWSRGTVPRYLRLGLGGGETLRGHEWGGYRGDSRAHVWLEERFPLLPTYTVTVWRGRYALDLTLDGAVFLDAGSIWERGQLRRGEARGHFGGGAGLRLVAPFVELFNLDVATDGKAVRVYGWGGIRL